MQFYSIIIPSVALLAMFPVVKMFQSKRKDASVSQSIKQEPRFGMSPEPVTLYDDNFDEEEHDPLLHDSTQDDDSLFDDVLLQPKRTAAPTQISEAPKKPKAEEIICLILMANPDRSYVGYELLQSLLVAGLRFGAMDIFHRFEEQNGRGKILFSVASISEPGTFEINKMGAYSGKGLMMFLRLSTNKDLMAAFDCMLETAKQLVEYLGGDIFDNERNVLSPEKIQSIRDRIIDFEQKQRIGDLFDT